MDLRRSTEVSLLAGRDFASQRDPFAPVRTEEIAGLLRAYVAADGEEVELALSWQCLELAGAQAVGRALRGNSTVTSLNLSCNALGDGGAAALAEALGCAATPRVVRRTDSAAGSTGLDKPSDRPSDSVAACALRVLNLSQNKLGDAGAAAVASLMEVAPLEEVVLNGNDIGDLGAKALAKSARNCGTLRKLWLGDNMIGERGVDALADALAASPDQIAVLWLGKQRPLLEPYPTPSSPARGRVEGSLAAIDLRVAQELTRKAQWTDKSQYGHVLAESADNSISSMARLERHASGLRCSLEQPSEGADADAGAAARSSNGIANGASSKLAQLNASNEELRRRIDRAKQGLRQLDAACGSRGFAPAVDDAALEKRSRGLVTSLPVANASTMRGQRFSRQPFLEPSAPLEWNAQHPQPSLKPPSVPEAQRAPVRPRAGPTMVEGSLGLPKPRTTGLWPTSG